MLNGFIDRVSAPEFAFISIMLFFAGFGVVSLSLSKLLRPNLPDISKTDPYECGVPPAGPMPVGYALKYASIAVIFLLFDIELIFIYPWAAYFRQLGKPALYEMSFFILILLAAYVVIWKKGVFRWK